MTHTCKPQKVKIYVNDGNKSIQQVKDETGCDAIINGGLYNLRTKAPACHLKVDGTVLGADQYSYWGYGWNAGYSPILMSNYDNAENYICCVCLVREKKREPLFYSSAIGGSRERTAIGTYQDGRLWLYASQDGLTPEELQNVAIKAGVQDAIMLDGGKSTQAIFSGGKLLSSRIVANYICVWDEQATNTIYRVQVGAFHNKTYATNMVAKLQSDGYAGAHIVVNNGVYRVQVGAFGNKAYAAALKNELTASGYAAMIVS